MMWNYFHKVMRHYVFKKKILFYGLFVFTFIILLHPDRNARGTYEFIAKENIFHNLLKETATNFSSTVISDCDYYDVINDESTLPINIVEGDLIEGHRIKDGGEYAPLDCKPKFSTAVIVPYR